MAQGIFPREKVVLLQQKKECKIKHFKKGERYENHKINCNGNGGFDPELHTCAGSARWWWEHARRWWRKPQFLIGEPLVGRIQWWQQPRQLVQRQLQPQQLQQPQLFLQQPQPQLFVQPQQFLQLAQSQFGLEQPQQRLDAQP